MLVCFSQRDFIIQTGDPTGTGRGGESVFWSVSKTVSVVWESGGALKTCLCSGSAANCMGTRRASLTRRKHRALSTGRRGRFPWWTTEMTSMALRWMRRDLLEIGNILLFLGQEYKKIKCTHQICNRNNLFLLSSSLQPGRTWTTWTGSTPCSEKSQKGWTSWPRSTRFSLTRILSHFRTSGEREPRDHVTLPHLLGFLRWERFKLLLIIHLAYCTIW